MQRIQTLLQKLSELSNQKGEPSLIDIDLMMDYTRVIYADLHELRNRIGFNSSLPVSELEATEPDNISLENMEPQLIIKDTTSYIQEDEPVQEIAISIPEPIVPAAPVQPVSNISEHTKPSIKNLVGINDTYLFITELFDGDRNAYEHAISKLDHLDHYQQAVDWLREHYTWEEDSPATETFFSILERFYMDA
ncbi:MAG: hypothetical protein JST70_11585 [Bacteroidetes bacterium]|nr:hypothetical protein [Bacteroidota bacterium]